MDFVPPRVATDPEKRTTPGPLKVAAVRSTVPAPKSTSVPPERSKLPVVVVARRSSAPD
jgi:hypothetical protein